MKRFELIITENYGNIEITSENEGFNALELIALLEMKKHDVVSQAEAQAVHFDRTMIQNGKKFNITESESTE